MEEQKGSIGDVAAVAVPPMQTSESHRISIIIPPSHATSKVMPFSGGATSMASHDSRHTWPPANHLLHSVSSQPHADAAESSVHHATHHHRWKQGSPKINAVPLIKKVGAEFLGTFILIFTVLSTTIMNEQHDGVEGLLGKATSAGLAVTVIVLSLIHISGGHLNPAVSIALAVFGHLPLSHILPYVAAQILGSIVASFTVKGIYHPVNHGITTIPKVGTTEAFFLEFIATFVLLFIVTAVAANPHAVKELIAVAAGATIMMNALVAGPSTGASMNPARTLGAAIATCRYTQIWIYMVATPLGAIAGTGAYVAIKL